MKKGAFIALLALAATAAALAGNHLRKSAAAETACCDQSKCDPATCDEPCEPLCCE